MYRKPLPEASPVLGAPSLQNAGSTSGVCALSCRSEERGRSGAVRAGIDAWGVIAVPAVWQEWF